jgi:hypothetical protein
MRICREDTDTRALQADHILIATVNKASIRLNNTTLYYAVNEHPATLQRNSLILADLQCNRSIVASGCAPLYKDLDSCKHPPLNALTRPLESKEATGFPYEISFGNTDMLPQDEERGGSYLLNG